MKNLKQTLVLLLIAGTASAVWGWGLPLLGKQQQLAQYNQWLERRDIDPSAMFYTELESLSWCVPEESVSEPRRQN